ncbi:MAG TPA: alpha/beta fold hydrolase [Polyangia bacterium]|jgi:pimeloyl-ACP methyl ester carboxylesterase|nr:alpha/beta fold hydrolase [Polyangia bacterium]
MPYVALAHAGRIHYAERGERRAGRPSGVFIHGAGAGSGIWSMTMARVARTAHAIAIDLPGHGPSALGDLGTLSLGRYRDAVGELCGALCLGPSVLVGHSMGALVALEAALAWPDKVRALVLAAAAPRMTVDPELLALLRDDPGGATTWLADHGLSPQAKPAVRRGFLSAGAAAPPEVTRADFEIVRATDLTNRLAAIACPITWLDGADDAIVPGACREGRRGSVVSVPDAGHLLPIEAPAAIAEAIPRAVPIDASRLGD